MPELSAIYNVEYNLTIVAEPDIPINPVAPRKMLNMAIATVNWSNSQCWNRIFHALLERDGQKKRRSLLLTAKFS